MPKFLRFFGFFHKFEFVEQLSSVAMRVKCRRCTNQYAVNMHMRAILRWTPEIRDFYQRFNSLKEGNNSAS